MTVEVDYEQHAAPRSFEVAIRLSGDLSEEQLERLEKVARSCPVRRALESGVEFAERIERRERPPVRPLVETGGAS